MKKLMIIALAFITTIGFSQDRERNQEMRQKMQQERQNLTPEQRAELNTKRLTIELDLTEAQQKEMLNLQLEMAKERAVKKQEMKNKSEEVGYYEKANKRMDNRKAHQDKMKAILSGSQYNTWKENMREGKRNRTKMKQKNKQ
jgi:periplasmic protein CpxP/Spy